MMDSTQNNVSSEISATATARQGETTDKTGPKTHFAVEHLKHLFQIYGPQRPEEIIKSMKTLQLPLELQAYVNAFAIRSEESVLERMQNNPEFVRCASWSELLDSKGFRETCNNEIPLALQTIAYTEKFPDAEDANGVDFQLLYLNLASMMMGQPVRSMNAATKQILKQVYEETVLQVHKGDHNNDVALLQERLKTMTNPTPTKRKTMRVTDLDVFFADPNLNPFQLPSDKIYTNRPSA